MNKIKGIKYIGPIFDQSGYAKACRGNILSLHKQGVPITLAPISFEHMKSDFGEDGKILKELVNKDIDYNVVLIHSTPEFWSKYKEEGKTNIGYTIWETDKLHPSWKDYINTNVDKVLVGCEWNVGVFKDSGVTIPIGNVPHGICPNDSEAATNYNINGISDDTYMFYSVFQWCYDDKTRVLTDSGYKYFKDVTYDDSLATLNLETEELEYHKPEKLVSFDRDDKMISIQGSLFDICVNPEHKMVVRNKDSRDWNLKPLKDILSKNRDGKLIIQDKFRAKKNCKWTGKEISEFHLDKLSNAPLNEVRDCLEFNVDNLLEFLGWYLSEGSTYKGKTGYVTTITQLKSDNYRKEILECIKRMGFTPFERGKDIRFNSKDMYYFLKEFGLSKDKYISKWVKGLSTRQIMIILTSLFKGDGSLYNNGDLVKYTTVSKQLAEDVQECLLKVGLSGAISTSDPLQKTPGSIDGRIVQGKLLQYTVSVNRSFNEPSMYYSDVSEIDYNGKIYCATVKNNNMLVERNGKTIFSGNTERKDPVSLIKAYWYAFQNNENVALVLKTYRSDYSEQEKDAIRMTINRLKSVAVLDNYPPIYLISDMLTEDEIRSLHVRGDCYVSLDRGEGFGLSSFTAGAYGKPIIVTGFGGSTEYAKEDNSYLVNHTLTPVSGMPWSPWYRADQLWAQADVKHGSDLMKYVYENKDKAKRLGKDLQEYIYDTFSHEVLGKKLISEIEEVL